MLALVALTLLLLEDDDLVTALVFENFSGNADSCQFRRTDSEICSLASGEYIGDSHSRTCYRIRVTVNDEDIAF